MKDEYLTKICDRLRQCGVTDMSKSILRPVAEPVLGSGILKLLSNLPVANLARIYAMIENECIYRTTEEFYRDICEHAMLEFTPYFTILDKIGPTIVCAVNLFVIYRDNRFMVVTDPEQDSCISVGYGDISKIVKHLTNEISTDSYNAIVADLICTAHMCKNLRDEIRVDGSCVTEFLQQILRDCKALPVYSIDTYKSKLSWVCLSSENNSNFTLGNRYNISIGSDAVTIEYMSSFGTLEHTGFIFDRAKLEYYDVQFSMASIYFAHALYLMVSDIYDIEFPYDLRTGIMYDKINLISELY